MHPVLFNASFHITTLRTKDDPGPSLRRLAEGVPVWLSSVVLEGLYAGVSEHDRHVVEHLERDFDGVKRIVVPNLGDWTETGRVFGRLAAMYDYGEVGKGRLTNDALIAMSAGRLGITVITASVRDFSKLAEFRSFGWRVNYPRTS